MLKKLITKLLLSILNSDWLNASPAKYAFVGNLDNFSREHLECEVRQRPHLMVRELLFEADSFKKCVNQGNIVIENGIAREMTEKDIEDINDQLKR